MKKIITNIAVSCFILVVSISVYAGASENENHSWLVRARVVGVIPDASSTTVTVIGGKVTRITSQVVPELDFSYFFTPHFAAELILATHRHSVTATGTTLGTAPLGRISLIPPTLTLQYHIAPENQKIDPYVGAGVNYTFFYNAKPLTVASIKYSNNVGVALQAGVNVDLDSRWVANVDVKKIFLRSTVTTTGPVLRTVAHIDPLVIGVGVGYRV